MSISPIASALNANSTTSTWDNLARVISHEIGNPLTSLRGFLTLLREQLETPADASMQQMLVAVNRLELIVREFQKLPGDLLEPCEPRRLGHLLRHVVSTIPDDWPTVSVQVEDAHCDLVNVNPELMEKALRKLLHVCRTYIVDDDNILIDVYNCKGRTDVFIHIELEGTMRSQQLWADLEFMLARAIIEVYGGCIQTSSLAGGWCIDILLPTYCEAQDAV